MNLDGCLPSALPGGGSFGEVFPGLVPNTLQATAIELISKQATPYLLIVEAPMGDGKTELALYAADAAMCRGFARGMYIAMPTQATGNAMFKRVLDDYLRKRGHQGRLNLQLVHGDALLARVADVPEGEIPGFTPQSIADDAADIEAQSWFTAKKRPLLAPFGVGTIDQSMLSVLQTRHWFVRLFGLAGKVVIFDEVHAYDAYMTTILERLLNWLAELDCTVILLSATLPESKRQSLANAFSGSNSNESMRYPRITLVKPRRHTKEQIGGSPICVEVPSGQSRTVALKVSNSELPALAAMLGKRLGHGGCAAVVCNTVDRSIEVYQYLRENLGDTECLLFHARTLRMWRRERESEVLRKFGKGRREADGTYVNRHRPRRAVLVATQVVEQSLDLDFDLMVSDMAPVDLLLQRSGRLHRHPRRRPSGLETPQFIVLCDTESGGPPPETFGRSIEHVYERYILLRTWMVLRGRGTISVPQEIEPLIEAVYGTPPQRVDEAWAASLNQARDEMDWRRCESEKHARGLLVSKPKDPLDLVEQFNEQLADADDPEVHQTIRAATREGDPSITVVMLPAGAHIVPQPDIAEARRLLDRSVTFSHRGLFRVLLQEGECPKAWTCNPHLRHARLLRFDTAGRVRIEPYTLTVNETLGVVVEKGTDHG